MPIEFGRKSDEGFLMREEFEKWYISKYLRIMKDAESEVLKLRNEYGGYDDENIDVAWEAWKHCKR